MIKLAKLSDDWLKFRYTLYSPLYDVCIGRLFGRQRERSIALAGITNKDEVLIVGAGTGLDLEYIKEYKQITAIDVSSGMLNRLRKRAKRLGIPVTVMKMDARQLSFPDRSFDVVILHMIVAVIPDYARCLTEVNRVLRPLGRVMVFDKFLPKVGGPSLFRKLINPLSIVVAGDLNKKVEDLWPLGLEKNYEEKSGLLNLFRIVKYVKE